MGEVLWGDRGGWGEGWWWRSLYGLDSDVSKHLGEKYQVKQYLTDVILFLGGIVGGGGWWGGGVGVVVHGELGSWCARAKSRTYTIKAIAL